MARPPKRERRITIPIHGNAAHNSGILIAIGGLIVNWSNNESVFMAMLQALVGGDRLTAAVVWQTQRTSRARLDLVARLVRHQVTKNPTLVSDIEKAISQFHGFSRARNFYCHATYAHDLTDGTLVSAHGMTLNNEGEPLSFENKSFNAATMNEISDTSVKLAEFNQHLWHLVVRLQNELGVQRVRLPQRPPVTPPDQESHPPQNEDSSPGSPPEPSQA